MTKTDYKIDGKEVSYEVTEDGYDIYLGKTKWISQREPYIPYPELSYEKGCLQQIEEVVKSTQVGKKSMEQLDRIEEAVSQTALTTEYLSCLQELNTDL